MRTTGVAIAALVFLAACTGSPPPEESAIDDAGPRLADRAQEILEIVTSANDGDTSSGDVTSDVGTLVPELYSSSEEEPLVLSFYLHDAGRDGGWDNGTLTVGGCMTIEARAGERPVAETLPCPQSVQDDERTYLDVELDVTTGEVADEG